MSLNSRVRADVLKIEREHLHDKFSFVKWIIKKVYADALKDNEVSLRVGRFIMVEVVTWGISGSSILIISGIKSTTTKAQTKGLHGAIHPPGSLNWIFSWMNVLYLSHSDAAVLIDTASVHNTTLFPARGAPLLHPGHDIAYDSLGILLSVEDAAPLRLRERRRKWSGGQWIYSNPLTGSEDHGGGVNKECKDKAMNSTEGACDESAVRDCGSISGLRVSGVTHNSTRPPLESFLIQLATGNFEITII